MKDLMVLAIVLIMSKLGTSQLNNNIANTNTPLRLSCGSTPVTSSSSLFSSLDSTISDLRSQLRNKDVYFARAHDLRSLDFVYGLAQCRNYLSASQCVACFDAAVSEIRNCSSVAGANVFLDNCFLRWVFSFIVYLFTIYSVVTFLFYSVEVKTCGVYMHRYYILYI